MFILARVVSCGWSTSAGSRVALGDVTLMARITSRGVVLRLARAQSLDDVHTLMARTSHWVTSMLRLA